MRRCVRCIRSVPGGNLEESISPDLAGFLGHGRCASGQRRRFANQHDVYGSVVLRGRTQMFDRRAPGADGRPSAVPASGAGSGERAAKLARPPMPGSGKYRGRARDPHLFRPRCSWGRLATPLADRPRASGSTTRRGHLARPGGGVCGSPCLAGAWNPARAPRTGALGAMISDASAIARLAGTGAVIVRTDPRFIRHLGRDRAGAGRNRPGSSRANERKTIVGNRKRRSFWCCNFLVRSHDVGRRSGPGAPRRASCLSSCSRAATPSGCCPRQSIPETGALWGNIPQSYRWRGIINSADAPIDQMGGCVVPASRR